MPSVSGAPIAPSPLLRQQYSMPRSRALRSLLTMECSTTAGNLRRVAMIQADA
jgi:hypothetical protein